MMADRSTFEMVHGKNVLTDRNPAETTTDGVIDIAALEALRSLDDGASLVNDVVGTFLKHAANLVEEFAHAESVGDGAAMLRIAHTLKSGSANVGAVRFSALCASLEKHLRAGKPCAASDVELLRKEQLVAGQELQKAVSQQFSQ